MCMIQTDVTGKFSSRTSGGFILRRPRRNYHLPGCPYVWGNCFSGAQDWAAQTPKSQVPSIGWVSRIAEDNLQRVWRVLWGRSLQRSLRRASFQSFSSVWTLPSTSSQRVMVKKEKLPSSTPRSVLKGRQRWLVFGGAHHMQMSWNSASNHHQQERKLSLPAGLCGTCYIHPTMNLRVVSMLWILSTRHPRCCHQNGRHHVQSVSCPHWSRSLEEIHMRQGEVCACIYLIHLLCTHTYIHSI